LRALSDLKAKTTRAAAVILLGAVMFCPAAGINIVFILTHTHAPHNRDHSYYAWHEGPVLFGTHAVSMPGRIASGGQISTFIPSIQIFDFYSIGRLPYLHFFLKVELKVNACYLRFSVR
jgi:hypothetical protein